MNQSVQTTQSASIIEHGIESVHIGAFLDFISSNRRLIAGIALASILVGAVYAFFTNPIYEANILIQLEDNPRSPTNMLGDLSSLFDIKTGAASEMEVLRSRLVVSRAVDNAQSYIHLQPKYFPVIGEWIARHNNSLSEPGLFGGGGYVWGDEQATVSEFVVPEELDGAVFVLTADGDGKFHLRQDQHGIDIIGRAGERIQAEVLGGKLELLIDAIEAKHGAQFLLVREPRLDAVERLQRALLISEKGKQSGIIGVSLEGTDPKMTSNLLNEIGREYIRQSVDRKQEEAEKSLAFLNQQLPSLKQDLEQSEGRYNTLRNMRGTMDVEEENRAILQQSISSRAKMVELKQKKQELLSKYQEAHPAVQGVNQQIRELEHTLATIDDKLKNLPLVEQDVTRLNRDVKINSDLYTALLSTARQLHMVPTNKGANARVLDMAVVPTKPVKPKGIVVISFAALVGLVFGLIAAFVRKTVGGGVNAPHEIKQLLGLQVSATIPYSDSQERLSSQLQEKGRLPVLAREAPFDSAVEGLRGFRASLQFAMMNSRNNIIAITGPTPGVGKSFVSANFAAVLASIGKKVLLIDGDLRTGHLHRYFGLERGVGLSDVVAGNTLFGHAIHREVVENVDFISNGTPPDKPAELLAHEGFGKLLQVLSARYDFVLIDTAPVLAVSDALMVGAHAGAIFSVVRRGVSTVSEIEAATARLNQAGHTVTGVVFNGWKRHTARYGYGAKQERGYVEYAS